MSKNKQRPPVPAPGGCSEPGREVVPESVAPDAEPPAAGGAVPIGIPIPLEHLEALQDDARRRKPRHPGIAQADPGETEDP